MSAIAKTCSCGRRVEPGQVCPCRAGTCLKCHQPIPKGSHCPTCMPRRDGRGRMARQPWRDVYNDPAHKATNAARYELVGGLCEDCGIPLKGPLHPDGVAWEGDHHIPARLFANPRDANTVENKRCRCLACHRKKTRKTRPRRRRR